MTSRDSTIVRGALAVLFVFAIVAMLAYARGEPGDDGRNPDAGSVASSTTTSAP